MIFFLLKPCLWYKSTPGQMPPDCITSHSDNYCSYEHLMIYFSLTCNLSRWSANNIYLFSVWLSITVWLWINNHLSTLLVELNNIKMYTDDEQYKNTSHIGLNVYIFLYKIFKKLIFKKNLNFTAAANMNVQELFYLICVILMFRFLT